VVTYRSSALLALGDSTRLAILERLADSPLAVVDLTKELPVSRPAVSQHLRVLKDAGLVIDQAVGNRRIYRIDPEGLAALRDQLDQFWGKAMTAYKAAVEASRQEE
jgi:DNA-binding transcriptional ArsR family regulator